MIRILTAANARVCLALIGTVALAFFSALAVIADDGKPTTDRAESQIGKTDRPELQIGKTDEYDYDPPSPGSYKLPAIKPAADGQVLHLNGRPDDLEQVLDGHITVLSFIYTRCSDPTGCPYATGVLSKVHAVSRQDPLIADNLQLITFSFDPEHDTPEILSEYSKVWRDDGGSDWQFLTTRHKNDLTPILQAYGQQVDRKKDPDDVFGPLYHTLRVYLIDRRGMIRNIYSTGMLDPRLVVTDVRTLLMEEQSDAGAEE